jgi:3-hydroxypropanoate dehydrogenase
MDRLLDEHALDVIFRTARTPRKWLEEPVSEEQLRALYDLMRWGPTSLNCFPVRIVFIASQAAKERLKPMVFGGNQEKLMVAPVTAIIGYDTRFYEWLPWLAPHANVGSRFIDKPDFAELTAFRNGTLQGAYFIIAARALGLDCGPMSGFDNVAVDQEFFPDGRVKSNFLCAIGHGDWASLHERQPRPDFEAVCAVL